MFPTRDHFTTLYSTHHSWLQRWLYGRLGCSHQAADIAHDAFIRLLRKAAHHEPLREPKAFLTTIAKGLLANYWRRQAVEQAYLQTLSEQPGYEEVSAEERYLIIESILEIDRLLAGLPGLTREIFLLSQLDELTYSDIAKQLGLTINQVQKAMSKAMRHCYEWLYE